MSGPGLNAAFTLAQACVGLVLLFWILWPRRHDDDDLSGGTGAA